MKELKYRRKSTPHVYSGFTIKDLDGFINVVKHVKNCPTDTRGECIFCSIFTDIEEGIPIEIDFKHDTIELSLDEGD